LREAWERSGETGHRFLGAAVQGVMALTAVREEERRDALAKGAALLREGSLAHCHIWFNRDAIEASLNCGAWSEAEQYADALEEFTRAEPLPWTDYQIAVGRAFAAAGRGNADRSALRACRETAIALADAAYLPALDAALARMPPH
jgi:hypothetical protein